MPTNLTNQPVNATFDQLLHVDDGPTGTLKLIYGGAGVATACYISTGGFRVGSLVFSTDTISTATSGVDINITPPAGRSVIIPSVNITGGVIDGVALTDVGTTSVEGAAYTKTEAVSSSSGTLTIDCDDSNVFTTTLSENISSLVLNNAGAGQTINLLITQDGTGSRTMSWPASFKWPGGAAPSLSTGAGEVDLLTASRIGSNFYATLIKDFS
jgi:hypothetical protein